MIGRTNAGGGGEGLKATDAILRVIAPAGSTVTISKGAVSKSDAGHENASDHTWYDYYFIIHASQFDSVNPWTVTATLGTQSISETIIIDSADEYDVALLYTLYLVKNGVTQDGAFVATGKIPASASSSSASTPTITQGSGYLQIGLSSSSGSGAGIAYLPNQYDLSKYSTVRITGTALNTFSSGTDYETLGFDAWTAIGSYQVTNRLIQSGIVHSASSYTSISKTVDISALTSSAYVGFNFAKNSSGQSFIRIVNMTLEV